LYRLHNPALQERLRVPKIYRFDFGSNIESEKKQETIMALQVGDSIPEATMKIMGDKGPQDITTADIFSGKKVVMFAVPGAFTPTCSAAHLPGFVANADKIKAKGVDSVVCISVNDAFVMDAWGKGQNAEELMMVADGNGDLTKAMGVELDGSGFGLGARSIRYSLIAEDGKITTLNLEAGGALEVSSAEAILEAL
jgi:peroxiredoxin